MPRSFFLPALSSSGAQCTSRMLSPASPFACASIFAMCSGRTSRRRMRSQVRQRGSSASVIQGAD
eukprot:4013005-Heterocapsa_arctica.AAC.1